jgi:hypothetical protein
MDGLSLASATKKHINVGGYNFFIFYSGTTWNNFGFQDLLIFKLCHRVFDRSERDAHASPGAINCLFVQCASERLL